MFKALIRYSYSLLVFAFCLTLVSCSGGKTPVDMSATGLPTAEPLNESDNIPESIGFDVDNRRSVLGMYYAEINPDEGTFTIEPVDRISAYHFDLTSLFPNVLSITAYGFTPNFWADIKISHPLPYSGIDAFDPRVIAVLPANPGVCMDYPYLNVHANNSVLLESDGYTKLWDHPGITGNTNPFITYFKDQPYRIWRSYGNSDQTQRWNMNLAGFGGPLNFYLIVDVSTNYPSPPQSVIDNAPEPVQIDAEISSGLTPDGGSATVEVTLLDWQGETGIGSVKVESPDFFNNLVTLSYDGPGPGSNEYSYSGTITNDLHAPEGDYNLLIATYDQDSIIFSYNEFIVNVGVITGNLIWTKRAGGPDDCCSHAITSLSDNSTINTGEFDKSATFGPGESNETILTSAGSCDIFIARYNSDGTIAWAKQAGGSNIDRGYGITTLSDNSTVVTGYFSLSATFGPDEPNETILNSAGEEDIFVARYNQDGSLAWAKRAGASAEWMNGDRGKEITALSDNSIVVTGTFFGSAIFGQDEPNETVLTSIGNYDNIFIARYNPDGRLAWAKHAGGGGYGNDDSRGITTLSDDSTVITGLFNHLATFGPGEPNETILYATAGSKDIFIARYNPDGTLAFAKRAGGEDTDYGSGITSLSNNSIIVIGDFEGSATFGWNEPNETVLTSVGDWDIFIARYNPYGTLVWAKSAGGINGDHSYGITPLSDDSTVMTGTFFLSATFGQDEPNETILTSDWAGIFIARYKPNGTLTWAKCAVGEWAVYSSGITTLSDSSTVATGAFWESMTFGPGEPNETVLTSSGDRDIYIARFGP